MLFQSDAIGLKFKARPRSKTANFKRNSFYLNNILMKGNCVTRAAAASGNVADSRQGEIFEGVAIKSTKVKCEMNGTTPADNHTSSMELGMIITR
jgi:hypothetical protein